MNWIQNLVTAVTLFVSSILGIHQPVPETAPIVATSSVQARHDVIVSAEKTKTAPVPAASQSTKASVNSFDPLSIQLGDRVGSFTVTSIGSMTEWLGGTKPLPREQDLHIVFTGPVTMTGKIVNTDTGYQFEPTDTTILPCVMTGSICSINTVLHGSLEENGLKGVKLKLDEGVLVMATVSEIEYIRYPSEAGPSITLKNVVIISQ